MDITAIDPYYDVGTATMSTSSRAVTGQSGTQWLANVVPGDQVYGADGRMGGIVETIGSNTSITLVKNWRGANQSAGVYTIHRVSDSVRVERFSQRLLNLLLGGNLAAFGDLQGAANLLPYFTGAGAMAGTPLTPFARSLLDDANAAGMLATLGVSAFMRGSVLGRNDLWGLGAETPPNAPANDLNSITQTGFYAADGSTLNRPNNAGNWIIQHLARAPTIATQVAFSRAISSTVAVSGIWMRINSGGWSEWQPLEMGRSSSGTGWFRTAGGLLVQGATTDTTFPSNSVLTTVFPTAFSSLWTVVPIDDWAVSTRRAVPLKVVDSSNTQFRVAQTGSGNTAVTLRWVAVGT